MVRVEVGGKPILDIAGIPESSTRSRVRQSITNATRRTHVGWSTVQPRIVLSSDTAEFDQEIVESFLHEGFQVFYLPYEGNHSEFRRKLSEVADSLDMGETYAIAAYGDAAALTLEACMKPMPKLVAVIAYYPPYMPRTSADFPPSLNIVIHLAGSQKFGTRHEKNYRYPNTQAGFAESDLDEFSKPAARVAWSRTLEVLRRSFEIQQDLEHIWDDHSRRLEASDSDPSDTIKKMAPHPYVNHGPTMTGGIGTKALSRFYDDFMNPGSPPDLKRQLLSRTVGTDQIVDETLVTFTHSHPIEWMLPGIPPTGKSVEVVVVTVVGVKAGKIHRENIYWDQATVLVQIGLLDPKYIPSSFGTTDEQKKDSVKVLPVLGAESARKAVDEDAGPSNKLIPER